MLPNCHTELSTVTTSALIACRRPVARMTLLSALWLLVVPAPTFAEGWVFRRSYYSHAPAPGTGPRGPVDPRAGYREAFVGAHPRGAIRGGYRWNNITLFNGSSTDRTVIREDFFDANY